jgi:hypothetical protein
MIEKIVSGGQTGVDRAALDTAISLGLPHGGWVPKGRIAEDGPLSEKYNLTEMPTDSYPERTEQNVIDSDGTLIIARGPLTGGTAYTRDMAARHDRPCLMVDLLETTEFNAALKIATWAFEHDIKVMNVAGPRQSKDRIIYYDVTSILESALDLMLVKESGIETPYTSKTIPRNYPENVDAAIGRLVESLSLKDRVMISKMPEEHLNLLQVGYGDFVRKEFGLWLGNEKLMEACRVYADSEDSLSVDAASDIIIRALWKKLGQTHQIRRVK